VLQELDLKNDPYWGLILLIRWSQVRSLHGLPTVSSI